MIFVDAGAFVAHHYRFDQNHGRAVEAWAALEKDREPLFTSNLVLNEAITFLIRRSRPRHAAEVARAILSSRAIEVLRSTRDHEARAIDLVEKYGDHRVGFTDCVSFVLMRVRGIRRVFGFDRRHFPLAGFELWPT